MGSKGRDLLATLLIAAIGIPYVGYLVRGEMPFIKDPRGMSAVGLILGVAAFVVAARKVQHSAQRALTFVAATSLVVGIVALGLAETAAGEALLAVFMGTIAVAWLIELSGYIRPGTAGREGLRHTS